MKWNNFVNQTRTMPTGKELTDIECPKCGEKIYRDTTIVLTSYPEQYGYFCESCGWTGTA